MHKTFNVNLAGQIFHINEDAFEVLSNYLKSLKNIYLSQEGGDEIISDIEHRISEILSQEFKNNLQPIITLEHVNQIIKTLGSAEQHQEISDEEEFQETASNRKSSKKMFRDADNTIIAGVCSGLSQYLGINDPIWLRLFFVISVIGGFGFGVILYIVLWIMMPKAVTASDKLQMKGEPINIENIEKTIKSGVNSFSSTLNDMDEKFSIRNSNKNFGDILTDILQIIIRVLKVLLLIFSLFFAFIAILFLFALGISSLVSMPFFSDHIFESTLGGYITFSAVIVLIIVTCIFLILLPIHLFTNTKKPLKKPVGLTIAILWIGALLISILGSFNTIQQFSTDNKFVNEETISQATLGDTLFVTTRSNPDQEGWSGINFNFFWNNWNYTDENFMNSNVRLNIAQSPDNDIHIFEEFNSRGSNKKNALTNARNIQYNYSRNRDTLIFDDFITYKNEKQKFRMQKNEITLYIPEGKVILFNNADHIIYKKPRIQNYEEDNDFSMGSTPWKLEKGMLVPLSDHFLNTNNDGDWTDITPDNTFENISIKGFVETEIIYSDTWKVTTNAPSSIQLNTSASTMRIETNVTNFDLKNTPQFKVKIYTPSIHSISTDGLTQTIINGFQQNKMEIEVDGNSTLSLNSNQIQNLEAKIGGLSSLGGFSEIDEASIQLDGMSKVKGNNLNMQSLMIQMDGTSEADVNVSEKIKGDLNGASTLYYNGHPSLQVKTNGKSEVSPSK